MSVAYFYLIFFCTISIYAFASEKPIQSVREHYYLGRLPNELHSSIPLLLAHQFDFTSAGNYINAVDEICQTSMGANDAFMRCLIATQSEQNELTGIIRALQLRTPAAYSYIESKDIKKQPLQAQAKIFIAAIKTKAPILFLRTFLDDIKISPDTCDAYETPALHTAVGCNNFVATAMLVTHKADVNAEDKLSGHTPLTLAASLNKNYTAQLLIRNRAILQPKHGKTPLALALENNNTGLVRYLLDHGALFRIEGEYHQTETQISALGTYEDSSLLQKLVAEGSLTESDKQKIFQNAIAHTNVPVVSFLFSQGFNPESYWKYSKHTHEKNKELLLVLKQAGYNLTHLLKKRLKEKSKPAEIALLIELGADAAELYGKTPALNHLAENKDMKPHHKMAIAHQLVKAGAPINKKAEDGCTPLFAACFTNDTPLIDFLLNAGAQVNMLAKRNFTPLIALSMNDNLPMLQKLLAAGADPNVRTIALNQCDDEDKAGYESDEEPDLVYTAPLVAVMHQRTAVFELLCQSGADIEPDKNLMLWFSIGNQNLPLTQLFIEKYHADVNYSFKDSSCLMLSCRLENSDAISLLLKHDADTETRDKEEGATALHLAADGHIKAVKLLLAKGANPNAQDNEGKTPLMIAAHPSSRYDPNDKLEKIIKLLLQANANPGISDFEGKTALDHAYEYAKADYQHSGFYVRDILDILRRAHTKKSIKEEKK